MTEINERLARFAWPDAKKIKVTDDLMCVDWSAKAGWVYKGLPFTGSLDLQAKYLWPKLRTVQLYRTYDNGEVEWNSIAYDGDFSKLDGKAIRTAHAPTPALASAQAIAKLLEGE